MYKKLFENKPVKTKSAQKVLQLMDKDWNYLKAVLKVSKEDKISRELSVSALFLSIVLYLYKLNGLNQLTWIFEECFIEAYN